MSFDWARQLIEHRGLARVVLGVAAIACLAVAPQLETQFDPEELVAADDALRGDLARIEALFGDEARGIVVLLDGREAGVDLTSTEELTRTHRLARRLSRLEGAGSVESLTTSMLPASGPAEETETLDDLEREQTSGPVDLLSAIVAADPERFPLGLLSLEGGEVQLRPIAQGEELSEVEASSARSVLRGTPLLRRRFVSDEGDAAVVVVVPASELGAEGEARLLEDVRDALAADDPREGVRVDVTGIAAMRAEMVSALREDQQRLIVLAMLGTVLVLALGMRSRAGVLLPLGTVGISLALALGLMVATSTSLNLLTNMLPPLLLTIGLAEAMHMVLRYRDELAAGLDRVTAAIETLRAMWLACFVTTFTTAVGFAALALQESEALRTFGVIAAVATMLTYVVTVLFVPTSLPSFDARGVGVKIVGAPPDPLDRALVLLGSAAAGRAAITIAVSVALGGWAAWMAQDLVVESRLLDQFARDSRVARTSAVLEQELDGFRSLELVLEGEPGLFRTLAGMEVLEAVSEAARARSEVLRATTVADWAHDANGRVADDPAAAGEPFRSDAQVAGLVGLVEHGSESTVRRFLTADGAAARIEMRLLDHGAGRTLALVEELESLVATRSPSLSVRVGGEAYVASRGLERIVSSLGSLAAAVVTIFVVMTLLFRSVRLGLLSIPPNALPLLMTLAYMVWRDIPLHAATVIVFTVTVGLAVDGTTHVVARYREELEKGGDRDGVLRRTVAGSGRAVLLSSITLIVGYLVLLASSFEPVRLFGELSAVAIGASTLSQTLLLPALLSVFGPRLPQMERRPSSDEVKAASSGK